MGEYLDWQPDDSPIKVRVHRRVLAGIEHEGATAFRGVLLGSASPSAREVLVEDFAPIESGPDFRPIEEWFAGWNRHSLPAVGYFRAAEGDEGQITENDRELFAKYFPDKLNVLLLFQIRDGKAQLAPVPAWLGGPRDTSRPSGDRGSPAPAPPKEHGPRPGDVATGPRAPMWEGDLPQRVGELAAWTQAAPQERGPRPGDIGAEPRRRPGDRQPAHRIGEPGGSTQMPPRETGPRFGDPPDRPSRERDSSLRPPGSTMPGNRVPPGAGDAAQRMHEPLPERARPDEPVEPDHPWRTPRRYLAQIAAVAAGFLLGVVGYLALRGERPGQIAPPEAPVSRSATQHSSKKAAPPAADTSAATTPVTPASTTRPSPFNGSSEANRTTDTGAAAANRTEAQQQIRSVLTRWSDSLVDGDVGAHVDLYAPTVSPYFTKKSVTRAQIRDDVKQMLARYGDMNVYKISDVSVTPIDANNAFATFRKHWETEGGKFSGEEREQLKLTRKGADWLIASEREVKVFWVKKK